MLKITIHPEDHGTKLTLEGRLAGPWVQELDRCWQDVSGSDRGPVVVDLTAVSYVDAEGKEILRRMRKHGADLRATGCLMRCIVEEIAKEPR